MIRVGGVRRQGSFLPGALESATGNVAQRRWEFRVVPPVLEEEVDEGVHVDASAHCMCVKFCLVQQEFFLREILDPPLFYGFFVVSGPVIIRTTKVLCLLRR